MNEKSKYIFVGNRGYVLKKMESLDLNIVDVFAVKGSFLHKQLEKEKRDFHIVENRTQLIDYLDKCCEFDYFISNGLPIILPIQKLTEGNEHKFINIHPSYLPELRGVDPVPGALLYGKQSGATCHYMDDGIDSGDIIAQIEIDNSEDLDAPFLYQLSFIAEADVFEMAYQKAFVAEKKQLLTGKEINYRFREQDLHIDLEKESAENIVQRIKAFSTKSKGVYIKIHNEVIKCYGGEIVKNKYCNSLISKFDNLQVAMICENSVVVRKDQCFLKLNCVENIQILAKYIDK